MTGRDFLAVAKQLAAGGTEAERRTAISQAYHAAFHVASVPDLATEVEADALGCRPA